MRQQGTIDRPSDKAYPEYVRDGELNMTTITAAQARKKLDSLVDDISESHEPVQIAGKRHSAVLISEEDWRAIRETLHLTSIPRMKQSIIRGLKTPVEKCHKEPGW